MKTIAIILIILLTALDNFGQFTLGPKIGYSTSKLSTDVDDIKESVKNNFQIGAFARLGKRLYLQPEFFYTTSGGSLKLEGTEVENEVKLHNLSIPALVGFKLVNGETINLRIMAGPVANFIISKKVTGEDVFEDPLQDSDFKNIAWGLDAGAGVDFLFLALDLRYEWGLNDIYDPESATVDRTMKSNLFIVSLGFKLF